MRRLLSILAAGAVMSAGHAARAVELPADAVTLHGRLTSVVDVERDSAPFAFNHASRSFLARTRLMSSIEAAAPGRERLGRLYLKGVALWSEADADGDVEFVLDQGDYLWRRAGTWTHTVRAYGNERRYFTHSIAPPVVDDDEVSRFENHGGVRVDGSRAAWSWSALGGVLDDGSDDMRRLGYGALRWHGRALQASATYLTRETPSAVSDYRGIIKGELAGFYRRATLVVSYEQAGSGENLLFLPRTSFDWDGYLGDNFSSSLDDAAAAFAEFRIGDLPLRERYRVDLFHRYRVTGPEFAGGLSGAVPGEVSNTTGLFVRHTDLALDGRLVYRKRVRSVLLDRSSEQLLAQARAFLRDGTEVYLRGAVGHRDEPGGRRTNDNFIHAAWKRSMRRLEAGVHVMALDIDDGRFARRFAVEMRMNWSASISVYGRLVSTDDAGSSDAACARLEIRPARHVFAGFGFGRRTEGDGPYVVEDPDIGSSGDIETVYTVFVRGDF